MAESKPAEVKPVPEETKATPKDAEKKEPAKVKKEPKADTKKDTKGKENRRKSKDKLKSKSGSSLDDDDISSVSSAESNKEVDEKGTEQIGRDVHKAPIAINRDEYLLSHRELSFEKGQQQLKNNLLHRRFAEYYKKRKLEHVLKPIDHSQDLEEKYQQKLFAYEELKEKEEREMADIKAKVEAVQVTYEGHLENAEKKFDGLQNHERSTGSGLIYSKKGKPIADKTVQRFLTLQRRKQEQASALCLRNIRARNAVAELDSIVKKLEKLGPGLYVAHYEQLRVDNQNYVTKIEEREDELIKNRTKCTEHNQILAHIREKMHHTDDVIEFRECDLGDAEMEYQRAREDLGQVKNRRDKLRWSLQAERMRAGLLTRKDLLRDYQDSVDTLLNLQQRKVMLETQIFKTNNALREARKYVRLQHEPPHKDLPEITSNQDFSGPHHDNTAR